MSKESGGNRLFYFLFGSAVGAVLALLFAPRKGSETRERLSDWLKDHTSMPSM